MRRHTWGVARGIAVALLLVSCDSGAPAPKKKPATESVGSAGDPRVPIESVSPLPTHRDANTIYNCALVPALQAQFAGARVENCGVLDLEASETAVKKAGECFSRAISARRDVLLVQQVRGTDSAVVRAYLVRNEGENYVAYEPNYDSDPCGGGCPDRGHTYVTRCSLNAKLSTECREGMAACLECDDRGVFVGTCEYGNPPSDAARGITREQAEAARRALLGNEPATVSAALGPIVPGAPSSGWTSPDGKAAVAAITASGIVAVEPVERDPAGPLITGVRLRYAGPCTKIRDELAAAWGVPPQGGVWTNPAKQTRAVFSLSFEQCALDILAAPPLNAWLSREPTAPVSLAWLGMTAQALKAVVGVELDGDQMRWNAPGIGASSVEVRATIRGGRVRYADVRGLIDNHGYEKLQRHLESLLGPSYIDAKADDGVLRWRSGSVSLEHSATTEQNDGFVLRFGREY